MTKAKPPKGHTTESEAVARSKPTAELTERQSEILAFIKRHIQDEGYPPSRLDICKAMNFASSSGANCHLKALRKKGVITLTFRTARGIALVSK